MRTSSALKTPPYAYLARRWSITPPLDRAVLSSGQHHSELIHRQDVFAECSRNPQRGTSAAFAPLVQPRRSASLRRCSEHSTPLSAFVVVDKLLNGLVGFQTKRGKFGIGAKLDR